MAAAVGCLVERSTAAANPGYHSTAALARVLPDADMTAACPRSGTGVSRRRRRSPRRPRGLRGVIYARAADAVARPGPRHPAGLTASAGRAD
ncbi:hypothetical protein ABTZ93_03615 [Streptomyces sp. NPDC097941]|uniref:hypothetical protein n=1 Tax=Streptomyces sp. NPDC097941 TaxID=3155685 RepID=UPI0033229838